jgi:hypothetical protein
MRGSIRVNRYKVTIIIQVGTMPSKKEVPATSKLVSRSAKTKTEEDLENEEYLRQLELAIENH